ncbi:uncharacterized protein K452DRAFT_294481 [Aplosporella prunicola CBS 121167]|uniref:Alcohol dehydrogenase-like N-terminal domain-containing protein n=1 Tax=Aplosporella prunicola CBS 121167 TaxID=1176127 RepID=A0A6A6BUE8_9PEZI|nr:uncharacterized protein K452DRAFT_294481 [Aplosporella prunicola CBS 121167]KAF2146963.1 hypothetical protein K452DRAFT_294481 [Aplosporella prunicola CBS 121167]
MSFTSVVVEEQNNKRNQSDSFDSQEKTESLFQREPQPIPRVPSQQNVLLLPAPKQDYVFTPDHKVPQVQSDSELLVKVQTIGLNPIDWKAPDFGFGIPSLPYIAGRDVVGVIVKAPKAQSRVREGDIVIAISTDYRDVRKAAFQEFTVSNYFNVCRVPSSASRDASASVGVAFIAASLCLSICFGVDFSKLPGPGRGPDLLGLVRSLDRNSLPQDVVGECFDAINVKEIPEPGQWIAIWGGSSTTAILLSQLAKFYGFRVIKVVDVGKHGERLSQRGADLLVDSHDHARAVAIIRSVTGGKLRWAVDTIGRDTASKLAEPLQSEETDGKRSHLVGLSGVPKTPQPGVVFHSVPIKIHHEVQAVGEALMTWLEKLLARDIIQLPDIEVDDGGLEGVNEALHRMRRGEISGKRLVVRVS